MSRFADMLNSRVVRQETVNLTYVNDWACEKCRKYGGVTFQVTGSSLSIDNRPRTHQSLEDMLKKVFEAHRGEDPTPSCSEPLRKIKIGLAWRYALENGERVMKFLPKQCKECKGQGWTGFGTMRVNCLTCEGTGGVLPPDYSWPPWPQL